MKSTKSSFLSFKRRLAFALVALCLLTGMFPDTALAKPFAGPKVLAQSVTVRESPPRITLQWQNLPGAGAYVIADHISG